MNALMSKEIRLVAPACGLALLLAVAPVWLLPRGSVNTQVNLSLLPLWFGAAILALSSFGREFGLQTLPLTLAQPLERSRIWWSKIAVLTGGLATVFGGWCLSCFIWAAVGQELIAWREFLALGATAILLTFAGGLWTTLLLRQSIAAFWLSLMVPWAISVLILVCGGSQWMIFSALGFYVAVAFVWAWRYFLQAQEVAWTGGTIALTRWRATEGVTQSSSRGYRPMAALCGKELQFHRLGLIGLGGLFLLHVGIVAVRKAGHESFGATIRSALELFGGLWLLAPLLVGSLSVAEERKLGTFEGHLSLPISRRNQFVIKLAFVLVLGGLLSALLLWSVEGIANAVGAGANFGLYTALGRFELSFSGSTLAVLALSFLFVALIGFYASTLTRGLVSALAVAVVSVLVLCMLASEAFNPRGVFGDWQWRTRLVHYIAWPTLIAALVWLAYHNFRQLSGGGGILCRNLLGPIVALVFIPACTWAVYHRAWEYLAPLEPAPGPARLLGSKPIRLESSDGSALSVVLPDGRLWVDRIAYDPGRLVLAFGDSALGGSGFRVGGKWTGLAGNRLMAGSNWVEAATTFFETVAIRADGTLWVSEKPRRPWDQLGPPPAEAPAGLVRFGSESNWQSVARPPWCGTWSTALLKQDGTLWRWWPNSNSMSAVRAPRPRPGLRAFALHRLGPDANWAKIWAVGDCIYAWKRDGRAWSLRLPDPGPNSPDVRPESAMVIQRLEEFDNQRWRSVTQCWPVQAAVGEDGSLWAWTTKAPPREKSDQRWRAPVQIGSGTNWIAVAGEGLTLVGLKADGSLWEWTFAEWKDDSAELPHELVAHPPVRLGGRHDWLAVGCAVRDIVSLAADGNLWYWWRPAVPYRQDSSNQPMLAPSRKPALIENILGGEAK